MEERAFFEVFPDLKLEKHTQELFEPAKVTRVAMHRGNRHGAAGKNPASQAAGQGSIRVYIGSNYLIDKSAVYEAEDAIKQQLFSDTDLEVKVIEQFHLSSQYTPRILYESYQKSIMTELRHHSNLLSNALRKATITFEDDLVKLKIPKNLVLNETVSELEEFLHKIFVERCGVKAGFECELTEATESKYRKQGENQIRQEIAAIASRLEGGFLTQEDSFEKKRTLKKDGAFDSHNVDADRRASSSGMTEERSAGQISSVNAGEKTAARAAGGADKAKKQEGFVSKYGAGNRPPHREKSDFNRPVKRSDNPDVIYGRDFDDEDVTIASIEGAVGEVVVKGQIRSVENREIRGERTIVMFALTDFTDTIMVKMFLKNEQLPEVSQAVKKGAFIKIRAVANVDKFDGELTLGSVFGIKKIPSFVKKRTDTAAEKRVELHCHTKMSDMDGVTDAKDLVKRAVEWGHKALAITDHGVVQGFTDAFHALRDIKGDYKKRGEKLDFKIIYGMEAYLVDDLKEIVTNSSGQSLDDTYVVFDIETTGFSPDNNEIIEIGAVKVEKGEITDRFSAFLNPGVPIPFQITQLTSITDEMVLDAPPLSQVLPGFLEFCGGAVLVAHNAGFDTGFIRRKAERLGLSFDATIVDTLALARVMLPNQSKYKLDNVAKTLGVSLNHHHRAVDDAECTAHIFLKLAQMLKDRGIFELNGVNALGKSNVEAIRKLPSYHAIMLATNEVGRVNLYTLVSLSHLEYYNRRPKIPKSVFNQYREGILLGSACEAGELYRALADGRGDEEIARLVNYYDYLEVQPLGNNAFMIRDEKSWVQSEDDLIGLNKRIIDLGERFNKMVVATCDVHFMDPEDEIYRRIIMAGKGFEDADQQAPLYLRTTEEMLKEFSYLDSAKAEEIVITNPNKIADMCEAIEPVRPDKCPPVIEDSDKTLREICYNRAHEMYGPDLPPIVTERLERELNSIISNGFAVMYIIAQKLVWKSNEDGYLVGSRGSVGSSFVATMAGITEVNPLSPHYYCTKCHYSEFDSEEVKAFAGGSGCDMPDKNCPVCGAPLVKAGFDIPFETFLGFKGNKEPDIDLNFSGEYQSKAHSYTEVIFGKGQTFRAGTVGTLADKTAFGYAKKYYEERGVHKRNCEIDRIVEGCVGVRRTTGQHPGGIIVLPHGENIYSFTPVQHPANDMTTRTVTTHFDYHSIDHNLLKLDILGHDDPTMIRMLQDLTGLDPLEIPLDDKKVMSLFQNTEALGITPDDIDGCPLGSLGVPEFGTDFAMQMLLDTKPQTLSDLIRIAGLAHGTDVWLGNAQTLIQEGKATISTAICCRDDIMIYLMGKGMDPELSFTIMEAVRKGKKLKPEWEPMMREHGVPEWYIWSCNKIKYMFPKAHAAAYVMMAFRIAYCKVYHPLAYYAAFFSIRATDFNYELMCQGREKLDYYIKDYRKRNASKSLTQKEEGTLRDMRIVQEMYARGFEFLPIDLYKAHPHRFQIMDGKLMPALDSIEGLGDRAADAVAEAAKKGTFLSLDDFRDRTKVSRTVIDLMVDLGILKDLPESNQLSIFDWT